MNDYVFTFRHYLTTLLGDAFNAFLMVGRMALT